MLATISIPDHPLDLLSIQIEVGYYPGSSLLNAITLSKLATELRNVERLRWTWRLFASARHMREVAKEWSPDILVSHWHGEYWYNDEHLCRSSENIPGRVIRQVKRNRAGSIRPFLAGQVSRQDLFYEVSWNNYRRLSELAKLYDMVFEAPSKPKNTASIIAIGLWNWLKRHKGDGRPDWPYDGMAVVTKSSLATIKPKTLSN